MMLLHFSCCCTCVTVEHVLRPSTSLSATHTSVAVNCVSSTPLPSAEGTLKAFANHGRLGVPTPADGGDCEAVLAGVGRSGIDLDALAARLQSEGAAAFVASWHELLGVIASKTQALSA